MPSRDVEIGRTFRQIADVLETLETNGTDLDIRTVTPVEDDLLTGSTASVEVGATLPFLDKDEAGGDTRLVPTDVRLCDDGSLRMEFQVTVEQTTGSSPETSAESPSGTSTAEPSARGANPPPEERDEGADTDPRTDGSQGAEETAQRTEETDDETDAPPYKDPERLQAVYDENETFSEMTDALDVDVTPQTVRRYMIKHGIHEPDSEAGSDSGDALLEADPDSILSESATGSDSGGEANETARSADAGRPENTERPAENDTAAADSDAQSVRSDGGNLDEETAQVTGLAVSETPVMDDGETPGTESDARGDVLQRPVTPGPDAIGGRVPDAGGTNRRELAADAEGVDLPDHVTLDEIEAAARDAETLYDVQRRTGVSRGRTRNLLRDLGLLDLVHDRLATRPLGERATDEINHRLQSDRLE